MINTEEKYLSNITSYGEIHIGETKFTIIEDIHNHSHTRDRTVIVFGVSGDDWVVLSPENALQENPLQSNATKTSFGCCDKCNTQTETTRFSSQFDLNEPIGDSIQTAESEVSAINSVFGSGLTVQSTLQLCNACINEIESELGKSETKETIKTRVVTDRI